MRTTQLSALGVLALATVLATGCTEVMVGTDTGPPGTPDGGGDASTTPEDAGSDPDGGPVERDGGPTDPDGGPGPTDGGLDAGGCTDEPENTPAACGDGCSNDGDELVDCDDPDCAGIGSCPPPGCMTGVYGTSTFGSACFGE